LRHPLQPSSGAAAAFEHLLTDNERILGPDHLETLATQRQGQHWRTQASDPSDVNSTSTSSERRARWPGGPQLPPRACKAAGKRSTEMQQPQRLRLTAFDPHGPADLRQRPSTTSMPLDGKEKVYGSIP